VSGPIPLAPSSDAWVAAALADLPTLLVDHAHCERKAAQTALRFLAQHADWDSLIMPLSRLAREELVHFERVLRELEHRGLPFRSLAGANYAAGIMAALRPASPPRVGAGTVRSWQGDRTVDEMLACALIEARSHERFVRLAAATEDPRLRELYEDLMAAEERHGSLYLELAEEAAGGPVAARLSELARVEAEVLGRPGQPVRMHAGG
jgi:tRNA-(ms[2]io[6]A)-hydroxylase